MQESEEEPALPDKVVEVCNYAEPTRECAKGALCYIIQQSPGSERFKVLARSRSGRWIVKWEQWNRFYNLRKKVIPPEHPRYNDPRLGRGMMPILNPNFDSYRHRSQMSNAEAQAKRREGQENDI